MNDCLTVHHNITTEGIMRRYLVAHKHDQPPLLQQYALSRTLVTYVYTTLPKPTPLQSITYLFHHNSRSSI